MTDEKTVERIAIACHEMNRRWCELDGDNSQAAWQDAHDWQRDSALSEVRLHLANPNAGPAASHVAWREHKLRDGWVYGPKKDENQKTHPRMVDFNKLPRQQQFKGIMFAAVVHAMAPDPTVGVRPSATGNPVTDPSFNPSGSEVVADIKEHGLDLAKYFNEAPDCRRREIALQYLEVAIMVAVKAAVCGDD